MNLSLSHKNALVGGGSAGIGQATAIELALLGANVTIVSRTEQALRDTVALLDTSQGQQHGWLVADYADLPDLLGKVEALLAKGPIHILVNNTGGPPGGPMLDASPEEFETAFHNHLIINQMLAQIVVPGMLREGYGRIINVISTSVKAPLDDLGVSNTVRAAVANWAKTLANELGRHGITVNNVLPGLTDTERLHELIQKKANASGNSIETVANAMRSSVPAQRFAEAHEIAAAAAFLATPAAAYINGTNITVDGGRTRSL